MNFKIYRSAVVFILSSLLTSVTFADASKTDDLLKLSAALNSFRELRSRPALIAKPDQSIKRSPKMLSAEVQSEFAHIQKFVFGSDEVLKLGPCAGCTAQSDAASMTVYIDPDFIHEIQTSHEPSSASLMIEFVIAHEISHFTYEWIAVMSPTGLSPNGMVPLLTKSFPDFVDLAKFASMGASDQHTELLRYSSLASKAHSEVDILAILTLESLGVSAVPPAETLLTEQLSKTSPDDLSRIDLETRLGTLAQSGLR